MPHWMLYPYVSSKYFILKIKSVFGGFEFFRLKVLQSPLGLIVANIPHNYGDFLGPPQIQVRYCGNTSYSCRNAS